MTDINHMVGAGLTEIYAIDQKVQALLEEAKTLRQQAMQPFLDALAASGEVSLIIIRGYTPGFNDGEPCEHSADFNVNFRQVTDEEWIGPDSSDDFGVEVDDEFWEGWRQERTYDATLGRYVDDTGAVTANRKLCASIGHVYDAPKKEILDAIRTLIFDTVEAEQDTNYYVTFILKNGKFEREDGEYDCGY